MPDLVKKVLAQNLKLLNWSAKLSCL